MRMQIIKYRYIKVLNSKETLQSQLYAILELIPMWSTLDLIRELRNC